MEILTSVRRKHRGSYRATWTDSDTEAERIEVCDAIRASELRTQLSTVARSGSFVSALFQLQLIEEEAANG
jgi:hypothetical protein